MTLQTLTGPVFLPPRQGLNTNGVDQFSALGDLDANGEKLAQIVLLPKAGNITKVHFRLGTVTTGDDIELRLETVSDTTGNPTGTLFGAGAEDTTVTIGSGDDDTWAVVTLGTALAVASGDVGKPCAVITQAPSSGYTGDLEIDMSRFNFATTFSNNNSSWTRRFLTGSWANLFFSGSDNTAVRLEYDDGSFGFLTANYSGDEDPSPITFASDSTPDEIGIKVRFPIEFQAKGIWFGNLLSREDSAFKVYNNSDVEQLTLQAWSRGWERRNDFKGMTYLYGDTATITANEWHRITCQPSTTDGSSHIAYYIPQATDAHWATWGLDQADYKWTERTDAGAWTDRDDRILFAGFIADQFHDGAGGGAASILGGGNLSGGFA